ncbi:MAG TPA: HAMP domain-containing protein, partial [Herpetosiphonaceae bacterium]|nr:HAMP domain-containing protein [Herpetosiphonaceae bacterium]
MRSLRQHLVLSYLLIIGLGVGGAAAATWIAVEQVYLSTQSANLLAQAEAVAASLDGQPPPPPDQPYSQFANTLPGLHTHVVPNQEAPLLNIAPPADLPVYYAAARLSAAPADTTAPDPDEAAPGSAGVPALFERSEIVAARQGRPDTAIRYVAAGDRRVLYAAAPVRSASGAVTSLVYIATPLPAGGWSALAPRTRWLLGAILAGLIGLAGALGWALAANLARPLSRLSAAAEAVAAGDLAHRVPERAGLRELRSLDQAFNTMTASLHRADQAKKAFVADVSHELRTPLTIIKGTVETLQDGAIDDLAVREGF